MSPAFWSRFRRVIGGDGRILSCVERSTGNRLIPLEATPLVAA